MIRLQLSIDKAEQEDIKKFRDILLDSRVCWFDSDDLRDCPTKAEANEHGYANVCVYCIDKQLEFV